MAGRKKLADKADKRYRAKVTVGHDADGRAIVKYASGRTRKELAEHKAELVRRFIGGEEVQRDAVFGPYAQRWFEVYKAPAIAPSTRAGYSSVLNRYIIGPLWRRRVAAITPTDLQGIINTMAGLNRGTVSTACGMLREIFRQAMREGITDRDPTIGLRPVGKAIQHRRALTEAETRAAKRVMDDHPDGLLLALLYYTGARIGEALALQWSDIDLKAQTVSISKAVRRATGEIGPPKTKNGVRVVPLAPQLADRLRSLRGLPHAFVFPHPNGGHYTCVDKTVWPRLMAAMWAADTSIEAVDGRAILTPHYFRHNFASVLYSAGIDMLAAQKFLGHADLSTTMGIYTHLADDDRARSADLLRGAFS